MYNIVPECYIDTMLVNTLVPAGKNERYNHQHGCFEVSNEMEKRGLKDKFAVGIIDNDNKKAKYLSSFIEIVNVNNDIKLFQKKDNPQYVIEMNPAIEVWILKVCEGEQINMSEFGLPNDLRSLKRITKSQSTINDERFINLFLRFKMSKNESVLKMMNWIKLLKDKKYQTDINELINA